MLLTPNGLQISLGTSANSVNASSHVLVSNDSGGAVVLTHYEGASASVRGTMTIPINNMVIVRKRELDTLALSANCNVTPVKVVV